MRVLAKIGESFPADGYWRYRRRDAGRLQFYFACRVARASAALSGRRSMASRRQRHTSSAPPDNIGRIEAFKPDDRRA